MNFGGDIQTIASSKLSSLFSMFPEVVLLVALCMRNWNASRWWHPRSPAGNPDLYTQIAFCLSHKHPHTPSVLGSEEMCSLP